MRRVQGSFTVFFAGILLSMVALLGALMESARIHAVKAMAADSSYLALQNVMAGYQRELWEEYHVFFVDLQEAGGEEGILAELEESLAESWEPAGGILGRDWMGVSCGVSSAGAVMRMTEAKGGYFESQAASYMKYRVGADVAGMVLEQLGLMKGLDQAKGVLGEKLKMEESLASLEKKRTKALGQLEAMQTAWGEVEQVKESLESKLEAWEEEMQAYHAALAESAGQEGAELPEPPPQPNISAEKKALKRAAGSLQKQTSKAHSYCSGYIQEYPGAEQDIENYGAILEGRRTELGEEPWQALNKDLEELRSYTETEGITYMSGLDAQLAVNDGVLDAIIQGSRDKETTASEMLSLIRQYQQELLPEQYELPAPKAVENPIDRFKNLVSQGVLALVLPTGTEVSKQVLEEAEWQSASGEEDLELDVEGSGLLMGLYAGEHFACFTEPGEDTALAYEREYLLMGKEQDGENLQGVVALLLTIRTVSDFLYLLTQPQKVAQARELAVAIAGLTGISPLITVVKTGILLAWAFDAAVQEVKELLQGEEVALYEGLRQVKLDYQGYLLLFSLVVGTDGRNLRMVRLVEGNTRIRHKKSFEASECAGGFCFALEAQIVPRFLPDGLVYRETFELSY